MVLVGIGHRYDGVVVRRNENNILNNNTSTMVDQFLAQPQTLTLMDRVGAISCLADRILILHGVQSFSFCLNN